MSCFIVGPNERPPVHSQGEGMEEEEQDEDSQQEELDEAEKLE